MAAERLPSDGQKKIDKLSESNKDFLAAQFGDEMGDLLAADVDGREMADCPAPTDVASDGIPARSPVLYEEYGTLRAFFCLSTPRYDENQAKNYSETSKVFQD